MSVSIKRCPRHASRLRVSVHESVGKVLGWDYGRRLQPLIGDGPDFGTVKLRLTDRNGFLITKSRGRSSRFMVVFRVPEGSPDSLTMTAVEYHVSTLDRSLVVRLPWAERKLRMVG